MKKRSKSEGGASAVEFALVLPLLLSVIFFSIDFAWLFFTDIQITNAARDGARRGAVAGPGLVESDAVTRATAVIDAIPGLDGGKATVAAVCVDPTPQDANVTVTVTYDFEPLVGFVMLLNVNLFKQIQATATMHLDTGEGC